jgi:hypothetical protein
LELESEVAAISDAFPDLAGAAGKRSRNFTATSPPCAHVCRSAKGRF